MSPKEWLRQERMTVAKRKLVSASSPEIIATELGFSSYATFRREFMLFHGISPRSFQEGRLTWDRASFRLPDAEG